MGRQWSKTLTSTLGAEIKRVKREARRLRTHDADLLISHVGKQWSKMQPHTLGAEIKRVKRELRLMRTLHRDLQISDVAETRE